MLLIKTKNEKKVEGAPWVFFFVDSEGLRCGGAALE